MHPAMDIVAPTHQGEHPTPASMVLMHPVEVQRRAGSTTISIKALARTSSTTETFLVRYEQLRTTLDSIPREL